MLLQWLQVFGRFHMLVLHVPIGLLAGLAAVEFLAAVRRRPAARDMTGPLAWLAALSAVLAAGMGYVLSFESGYGGDVLTRHLYLGVALACVCMLAAALHAREGRAPFRCALVLALALLIPTGHLGGTMTHGEDFLMEPLRKAAAPLEAAVAPAAGGASFAEPVASTFASAVVPIFESRCVSCHGRGRAKGGLALHAAETVAVGGKHGPVLDASDPASSELLRRLRLPVDHKEHMPPRDKPQLTADELGVVEAWVLAGASFDAPMAPGAGDGREPASAGDQAARAPSSTAGAPAPAGPPSNPAPQASLAALRERLAHVELVEQGSTLLWIDFAAAAATITDDDVESLLGPVKSHVAELSLARSGITDRALTIIAAMPNLRRLDLRGTAVTDAGLAALRGHPVLEELVVAQTRLSDAVVDDLSALPSLKRLNVWRSGISHDAAVRLSALRDSLAIEAGDRPAATALETEGAITLGTNGPGGAAGAAPNAGDVLKPRNTVCPVSGKAVDPDYAIVYRGRVVGFCCRHCAEQFWIEPAKYEKALEK